MDDERRRGREYYQVNLDTGRIFWIAFLLGIIVIAIFVLGYYVGGDKLKKGLGTLGRGELSGKTGETTGVESNKIPPLNIFNRDLESETGSLRLVEPEKRPEPLPEDTDTGFTGVRKKTTEPVEEIDIFEDVTVFTPPAEKKAGPRAVYRERGDYYIQVASFLKKENADALAENLRKKLYKVDIQEATVDERLFFRVQVGPFETEGIARNTMIAMRNRYDLKDPFVVKKSDS